MPNYCDYRMRVKGYPNNVQEFINVIQAHYDYKNQIYGYNNRHFFRVFEATVTEDINGSLLRSVEIVGYCAWSVWCCMMEGPMTYHNENIEYGTSLLKETQRLNLLIEVYSTEPGMCFSEHYIVVNGRLQLNDENEYIIYYPWYYDTVEEFNEENNLRVSKEYFELLKKYEIALEIGANSILGYIIDCTRPMCRKVK